MARYVMLDLFCQPDLPKDAPTDSVRMCSVHLAHYRLSMLCIPSEVPSPSLRHPFGNHIWYNYTRRPGIRHARTHHTPAYTWPGPQRLAAGTLARRKHIGTSTGCCGWGSWRDFASTTAHHTGRTAHNCIGHATRHGAALPHGLYA
eukprot:4626066-Pyramimonas_sp.AAC.1